DWHLGKMLFGRSMLDDQRYFIDNIFIPTIAEQSPDAIILSGDIFDRAIAPVAALELFDDLLTRIAETGIPFIAITGNHDGAQRLSLGSRLMRQSGIYIFTSLSDCLTPVTISSGDGTTAMIHPLPYFDASQAREFIGADSSGYDELFGGVLSRIDTSDRAAMHILAAHCTVLGSLRCESESGTMVGGSFEVGTESFAPFDAVLLGHLHSRQNPASNISYCGSPLRYSFDAGERDKSLQIIELTRDGCTIRPIPIKPLREMRVLRGSFDSLMSADASDDYIYAELEDDSLIYEPISRLRERYPNILGMRYADKQAIDGIGTQRAELTRKLRTRSLGDAEVLDAFLRQMCADAPTDGDFALFSELCRSVDSEEVTADET
ncbi:MAG: exonuclease SbcCD subunit D, partial [Clostridia bacterium]|nr:exonuclease SbcCD subunit D [Clostridia bacterium]